MFMPELPKLTFRQRLRLFKYGWRWRMLWRTFAGRWLGRPLFTKIKLPRFSRQLPEYPDLRGILLSNSLKDLPAEHGGIPELKTILDAAPGGAGKDENHGS